LRLGCTVQPNWPLAMAACPRVRVATKLLQPNGPTQLIWVDGVGDDLRPVDRQSRCVRSYGPVPIRVRCSPRLRPSRWSQAEETRASHGRSLSLWAHCLFRSYRSGSRTRSRRQVDQVNCPRWSRSPPLRPMLMENPGSWPFKTLIPVLTSVQCRVPCEYCLCFLLLVWVLATTKIILVKSNNNYNNCECWYFFTKYLVQFTKFNFD
jgi:hypothetical protein